MRAMLLTHQADLTQEKAPLEERDVPPPSPGRGEILLEVTACGVCHTELDEIEGRTPPHRLPVIPGHQVIGRVREVGPGVSGVSAGERMGVAWIFSACGACEYCRGGQENLCPRFQATGRDVDGGYAEWITVPAPYAYPIPERFSDSEAAPLLCAGAVGYRSIRLTGMRNGQALGLTGFGASAHLVLQTVKHLFPDSPILVFARNPEERAFALELGAAWAGGTGETPPVLLDAMVDTTPVWQPVLEGLKVLKPGGRLVINAIRKESTDRHLLAALDYPSQLWHEKEIKSVANVTRVDVQEFLRAAAEIPIHPEIHEYALEDANTALLEMKSRTIRGAKVLRIH
jgi:propanol-preferring alcohol dehydrogenase